MKSTQKSKLAKQKKSKKKKHYKYNFKLSENRKMQLDLYCKQNNTTSTKVIKGLLNELLDDFQKEQRHKKKEGLKNQLKLFDVEGYYDKGGAQLDFDM
ncbi:MAG: hypothetical protein ACOXZK_04740 [Bacteroidales bacterium]|jgi:hypothetical protein